MNEIVVSNSKPTKRVRTIYKHTSICCGQYEFSFTVAVEKGDHHQCGHNYQWGCDKCGAVIDIVFTNEGKESQQTITGKRSERTLDLLRIKDFPQFLFIYRGCGSMDEDDPTKLDDSVYWYEEGTCPTNLFGVEEIIYQDDDDPHGVFEVVERHLITGPYGRDEETVLEELKEKALQLSNSFPKVIDNVSDFKLTRLEEPS